MLSLNLSIITKVGVGGWGWKRGAGSRQRGDKEAGGNGKEAGVSLAKRV